MIHPTAIIHPRAKVDATASVGPYAVIDEQVELGANCIVGPHVYLTGVTMIGAHNQFHAGCVIGDVAARSEIPGEATRLRIGDHNVFREHVTVNRSVTSLVEDTVIGSHNFLMAHSHVGHNVRRLGSHGHPGKRRDIGRPCFRGGPGVYFRQLPRPPVCADRHACPHARRLGHQPGPAAVHGGVRGQRACGCTNTNGPRRADHHRGTAGNWLQTHHRLFRGGQNLRAAVTRAREEFAGPVAKTLLDFVAASKRGICGDVGTDKSGG